jgi:GT2 family glycosyltransferase
MTILTSTAAVIVTFNRSAKLMRVLDALEAQTQRPDLIFVVDNASTDDTRELVTAKAKTTDNIRYLGLPKNIGGAGGFHEGMKAAYAAGAQYLWISDDDAYPQPDAIEKLLDAIIGFEAKHRWRPSFACSRVEWIDDSLCEMNTPNPVWDWPRFITPGTAWALVNSCSFVSVLIPRWAITAHGYPIADYFIWFDDAEYTRRLSRSYPGIFVPESRVTHDTPENKGVNYALVTQKSVWKFEYGARNETSFRRREQGFPGVAAFAWAVRSQMRSGQVPGKLRRRIYAAILRGWAFRPKIVKAE